MADKLLCSIAQCDKPAEKRGWCNNHYRRWLKYGDPCGGGPMYAPKGEALAWLESQVYYSGSECLRWPFTTDNAGYAVIWNEGRQARAYRLMCELRWGPPPSPSHLAAHRCGCGKLGCIAPTHLYWATPKQNKADELVHGTRNRGEKRWNAKLTEADVREIRNLQGYLLPRQIADLFNVSRRQVAMIHNRKSWAWLR